MFGNLINKFREINMSGMIGQIGNGSDHDKGNVVVMANLRHRGAFHFHGDGLRSVG